MPEVQTTTPANTPEPIGPYNHIAKVGPFITIGGTAGVNPTTGKLAGAEIAMSTKIGRERSLLWLPDLRRLIQFGHGKHSTRS